ncbi:MAG: hypothetical protein K0R14_303 [Burkholderiales bacterium]|jgi:dipeptidyl aminopeptidase/acylaminoacyl peptidase|nr:hypothetical protein [Burkholderiales bacterium]
MKTKLFIKFYFITCTLANFTRATSMDNAHQVSEQPLTNPLAAKPGKHIITPDWLLKLPKFSLEHPAISWLDNSNLIYSIPPTESIKKWQMEIINITTGKHKLLGDGSIPKLSPDGKWIAFSRGDEKTNQLWVMEINSTKAKQLSNIKGGLGVYPYSYDFAWSPGSKQIALKHQQMMRAPIKNPPKSVIDIIDITSGVSKQLVSLEAEVRNLSWFPNGKELLFMKQRAGFLYNNYNDYDWVQSINIDNREIKTLAEFDGLQQSLQPTISPDGKLVAFMYDADNPIFNFMPSLGLVSTNPAISKTSPIKRLTYEIKLDSPQWSPDGQQIYVLRVHGAYKQIYTIDVKTGAAKQKTNAPLNIENYSLSPNGSQLALVGQDAQATRIVRITSSTGQNVRDIITIPGVPKDIALSEIREIDWKTPDYPVRIRGLLFLPLNYESGQRYPLIIDIHGGGSGAHINLKGGLFVSTPLEWQMWTAKGYAVFVPEFRSSGSFGSIAATRDAVKEHNILGGDLKDIEAGVDTLITQGIVNEKNMAIIGHSAGAVRVNWAAVATHRYRAIISKDGWADDYIPILNWLPSKRTDTLYGGSPKDVPQNYLKNSALYHSAGVTTPILFLMNNPKLGGVDAYNTVNIFYQMLKAQKVDTQYVKYQDEGHVVQKPKNLKDLLERSIKWIDSHMKTNKN